MRKYNAYREAARAEGLVQEHILIKRHPTQEYVIS